MADFPSSVKTFPTLIDLVDSVLAAHQNERGDEITAIENYLLNLSASADGWGLNYQISPSVSSNNLSLDILGLDGNAPSASNPVKFRIGNTVYTLTSATTFTKNAATNWLNLGGAEMAALPHDLFVYGIAETGASAGLKFGYSRLPFARTMGDFTNTPTSERYIAGNWTNFNSTDIVRNLGRFRAQLSAGAGYTWSIPSSKIIHQPVYDTDWLDWQPVFGGFGGTPPTGVHRYKLIYDTPILFVRHATNGVSTGNNFTISLPFTAKTITNMTWGSAAGVVDNNVVQTTPGVVRVVSGASVMDIGLIWSGNFTSWTATGNKRLSQMNPMVYEI